MFGFKKKRKPLTKDDFKPVQGTYAHFSGLPVPGGTMCTLALTEAGLAISSLSGSFNLSVDKMVSIATKTDTEEQITKQYVSSAGGAIAGAIIAGVPGALIGGRAKEKEIKQTTYKNYMVVTYKKDAALEHLVFALKGTPMDAMPFVSNFGLLTLGRAKEITEL